MNLNIFNEPFKKHLSEAFSDKSFSTENAEWLFDEHIKVVRRETDNPGFLLVVILLISVTFANKKIGIPAPPPNLLIDEEMFESEANISLDFLVGNFRLHAKGFGEMLRDHFNRLEEQHPEKIGQMSLGEIRNTALRLLDLAIESRKITA